MKACIETLASKLWLSIKYGLKKHRQRLFEAFFSVLGLLTAICECENLLFSSGYVATFVRKYVVFFLLGTLIYALYRSRESLSKTCFVGNSDTRITIKVGNILLGDETAIVIPTNSTFDTKITNDFISIKSVQGQYQQKFFRNELEELDRIIATDLASKKYTYETLFDRTESNTLRYPIGSVAQVYRNSKRAYFLSMSNVNVYGKPENVTLNGILESLFGLWNYLSEAGYEEPIAMPVIGTGRAGVRDATMCEIIKEMIFSFAIFNREQHVANNLTIYIHPKDIATRNLTWQEITDYLEITCKSLADEHSALNMVNAGIPLS